MSGNAWSVLEGCFTGIMGIIRVPRGMHARGKLSADSRFFLCVSREYLQSALCHISKSCYVEGSSAIERAHGENGIGAVFSDGDDVFSHRWRGWIHTSNFLRAHCC
jgi:hypothetical protein